MPFMTPEDRDTEGFCGLSLARCTIYTAVYKDQPVVVKLMRKDVQDASLVRHELELELALLRR